MKYVTAYVRIYVYVKIPYNGCHLCAIHLCVGLSGDHLVMIYCNPFLSTVSCV